MANKWLERIYASSPVWMQQLGINAYGWYWARRRLGAVFEKTWREYAERESWSAERVDEFVKAQLRHQVQRAYREVPYYRDAFRRHGLTETLIEKFTLSDLQHLPFLEKSVVRANPEALLTETSARKPPPAFATSGTTGTPIRVYWDSAVHQHNIAVREARSYRWAGVSIRDPRSMLGGRPIVPQANSRPPFWRYNRWEHQLYLSAYHISPANLPDYVAALNRFQPVTMTGYAAANFLLARLIGELGLKVHHPRAIITGSERLEPDMRGVLQTVFRAPVFEEYGSVENCSLATECERGSLHVHRDFGLVEIVRPDGSHAAPGETGQVVVTGFANYNQIFIRYRLGDLAAWAAEPCPCGRAAFPVLQDLLGRQEDTILGADGREVARFYRLLQNLPGVAEGQVIQETLTSFQVNVVPAAGYSPDVAGLIRQRITSSLGPDITVRVSELD
ncbi:MAG: phenylacetate--CoA ligase family protein, partial [Terriglobales bacterium]